MYTAVPKRWYTSWWMESLSVRDDVVQVKARDGAERSQPVRRRKRGQRKGVERRSRGGKPRRSATFSAPDFKSQRSRKDRRNERELGFVVRRSQIILEKVIEPKAKELMEAALRGTWHQVQWYRRQKRCWSNLLSLAVGMKSVDHLNTPVISFFSALKLVLSDRERSEVPDWNECGFGSPFVPVETHQHMTSMRAVPPPLPLVGRTLGQVARDFARGNKPPRLICRRCGYFHTEPNCLVRQSSSPRARGTNRRRARR